MSPLVSLQGVARRYPGGTLALQDLDLAIDRGSFITLLGPSGCGKSTVLRLLAGLDEPSAGRVAWDGGRRPVTGRTGFVFQEPTLMPWARVDANVALPLKLAGLPRQEQAGKVDAAMAAVGLAGFAQAYPHQLSGGMKMRASIARALVTQPELLLLDEPFAALDEVTRFALQQDLLAQWSERRFTAVFVTHSIGEAAWLSQRIAVMGARPGRVMHLFDVPFGPARTPGLRHSMEFAAFCAEVSAAMREAMSATERAHG
ncbi:MAG: ABC transporter ATP-binding protein [Aquabacterium sp.]|nr:MAG: ABC transporter ATP-binding protein [Aquabacterium sp.]